MSIVRNDSSKHIYHHYGLGAVIEDCCIHTNSALNPLSLFNLVHWSVLQAKTTSYIQERWVKQLIRYLLVVKGSIEVFDRKSGSMKRLSKGDAWLLDAGPGYLLKETYDRQSVILNLNFKSVNIKPIYQSNFLTFRMDEQLNREDGIEIISYDSSGQTLINLPIQLQKTKMLFLPQIKIEIPLDRNSIYTVYFLKGSGVADSITMQEQDFFIVEKQEKLLLETNVTSRLIICKFVPVLIA